MYSFTNASIYNQLTVLFVFKTYCYKYIMQKSVLFFIKASLKSVIFYSFYMCLLSFCFFFWEGGKVYSSLFFFLINKSSKLKQWPTIYQEYYLVSHLRFTSTEYFLKMFLSAMHTPYISTWTIKETITIPGRPLLYKWTWKVRLVVRALGTTIFWPFLFSVSF